MAPTGTKPGSSRYLWVLAAGATSAGAGYVVYRYWLRDYISDKWLSISGPASSAWRILESVGELSDLSSSVASDLKRFLESDTDEVPRSLRQMLKLSRSPDFQQAVLMSTQSLTEGVCQGLVPAEARRSTPLAGAGAGEARPQGERQAPAKGFIETVMGQLFTDEGKSFASTVCSRMVRTLVTSCQGPSQTQALAACTSTSSGAGSQPRDSSGSSDQQKPWPALLVELLATERGKDLVTVVVRTFAVECIGTYLDKIPDVNMYHDMLSAVSRHPDVVKDVGTHVATTTVREVVSAWAAGGLRGGGAVPRPSRSGSCSSSFTSSPRAASIPMSAFSDPECEIIVEGPAPTRAAEVGEFLAQPAIRRLVLDLTAVMTTRGMEAFLLVMFSKLMGASSLPALKEVDSDAVVGVGAAKGVAATASGSKLVWMVPNALASRALAASSVCLAVLLHYMSMSMSMS